MYPNIDRLVTKDNFSLGAWHNNWSHGIIVVLAPNEYALHHVREICEQRETDLRLEAFDYLLHPEWLPFQQSYESMTVAMNLLEMRLATLPSTAPLADRWAGAVHEALEELREASWKCEETKGLSYNLTPQPKTLEELCLHWDRPLGQ